MFANTVAVFNETYKGLLLEWHYKFNLLLEGVIMGIAFVGISFLVGGGRLEQARLPAVLLGYVVWLYAMKLIVNMSWHLRDEAQTGTMEQMYMSPTGIGWLLAGRVLSRLLSTTAMVAPLALALSWLLAIPLPWRPAGIPVFGLTLVGVMGLSFMVAGATLVFKHVEALGDMIQYLLLFVNGALVPVDNFPGWLAAGARLLPTTAGIVVLRRVVLEGVSLRQSWHSGQLPWLVAHSFLFLVLGWLVFKWCERVARRQGSLGQY